MPHKNGGDYTRLVNSENLCELLENRLNPLIYKEHEEFNFSPKHWLFEN